MRLAAIFALTVLLMQGAGIRSGHAESRIALVIGNGAYQHLRPLGNPSNDAHDLARALEGLGFTVDLGVDLGLVDMQRKVTDFSRRAGTADVALAFFAGHGVQAPACFCLTRAATIRSRWTSSDGLRRRPAPRETRSSPAASPRRRRLLAG